MTLPSSQKPPVVVPSVVVVGSVVVGPVLVDPVLVGPVLVGSVLVCPVLVCPVLEPVLVCPVLVCPVVSGPVVGPTVGPVAEVELDSLAEEFAVVVALSLVAESSPLQPASPGWAIKSAIHRHEEERRGSILWI